MKKSTPKLTVTQVGAMAFAAAFFSLVAVLAVIGGTTNAQETDASDIPLALDHEQPEVESIEVAAAPEAGEGQEKVNAKGKDNERDFRPPRRGPGRRGGPPAFEDIDANGDEVITPDEFRAFHANRPGPQGRDRMARRDFDGPPRGPRGDGEFRGGPGHHGPPPHMREGRGRGQGEFRGGPGERGHDGPPPHMRGGHGPGRGEFRGGPGRGGPGGRDRQGPPPRLRGDSDDQAPREFERGPRGPRGGGESRPPARPRFNDLDADGDGSISEQEFDDFRPRRGPRGPREDLPREESF